MEEMFSSLCTSELLTHGADLLFQPVSKGNSLNKLFYDTIICEEWRVQCAPIKKHFKGVAV